ncbi:DUF4362 domain-containing protein [Paenibacillus sp. JX-17]|uniref:DUF4362 domain-containing protein n=1 Tax=Paenibacillus lacisoli TaxID=3064525 RepID=A0ABT9C815_9BACL|nr:DUF4362 domain-containing protein [Paenibacillus sp. JX-17]MDO7905371.1 DUF4362 domain-containing protein [Paenibacillus sp. JX-17]
MDEQDYRRVNEMYERYQQRHGDHLMIILPAVDSCPTIYNLSSNGRQIDWSVDESRDIYSGGDVKVHKYSCSRMNKDQTESRITFSVSGCAGYSPDEKLGGITFTIHKKNRPRAAESSLQSFSLSRNHSGSSLSTSPL